MTNATVKKIAKKLKQARLHQGLTQVEAAKKAGVSVNYYARIERAEVKPSLDIFENIVKALKVKSSDILHF